MKVKELIEKLQKLDQEEKIYILSEGDSPFDYGYEIKRVYEIKTDETNASGVYIEEA